MKKYRQSILLILMLFILYGCQKSSTPLIIEKPSTISTIIFTPSMELTRIQPTMEPCKSWKAETLLDIPDITESVAVTSNGSVITASACKGLVYRIDTDGSSSVIGRIPFTDDTTSCDRFNALGIAVGEDDVIWVVVSSPDQEFNGIWRIHADGSSDLAYPIDPNAAPLLNDLIVDPSGNLYITESINGLIWKASPGSEAYLWLTSDLLAPTSDWIGANGIAFRDNVLYVGNFSKSTVVKIPVENDGSPGTPVIFTEGVIGIDGIDFDTLGNLLGVSPLTKSLIRIPSNKNFGIVMDLITKGMAYPTGIAVSKDAGESNLVYISEYGIGMADIYETGKADIYRLKIC